MILSKTVRLLALLLVAIACMPIYSSEEFPLFIWFLVGGGLIASWFTGAKAWPKELTILNTIAVIVTFALMTFLSLQSGDWLINSVIFGLVATVIRALQTPTSRQLYQLIALSFLLMVAAAVTNPDLSFALYFLAYTVLLTWSLTYTHLLQRVEEAQDSSGLAWKASRLISRRFLLGSSALALLLLVSSMVIFIFFPRLGLGFFSAQTRRGNPVTGFSEELELGHFGTMQDSERTVMRVEFQTPKDRRPLVSAMHFRGVSFETYDGRAWSRKSTERSLLPRGQDGFYEVRHRPRLHQDDYRDFEYDIYLEPLDIESKVLFSAVKPIAIRHVATRFDRFRGTTKKFFGDILGNLSFTGPGQTSTAYTVRSGTLIASPEKLRRSGRRIPHSVRELYLQVPGSLDDRVKKLAGTITADADNPYDAAVAVKDYLQSEYGYTKEGTGTVEDPVADFLFDRREGHCEYFATAMVILLRAIDIPARPVNGFLGASYNEFGDFYTVSESRAHSWVEVHLSRFGWIMFDPTPAIEPLPLDPGFLTAISLWMDALQLRWYKWVVEYDLEKQLAVYSKVWNLFASQQNEVSLSPNLSITEMKKELKKMRKGIFSSTTGIILAALVALLLISTLLRLFWRKRSHRQSTLDKLARKLRRTLRRKGFTVSPGTTLPALSRMAVIRDFNATPSLVLFVAHLEEARWNPDASTDLRALRRLLNQVRRGTRLQT
jgi:protein-glutamine gamma-glutamyltransferase